MAKRYNFIFEDGSNATLVIELQKDRHKDMTKELDGVTCAIRSIIRDKKIRSYTVAAC